jgi:hypothetical protein
MLFKIASRVLLPGMPPINTSDPAMLKMAAEQGAKISIGEIKIYKLRDKIPNGMIRSRYETKDPAQVRLLMKVGSLDFDPQDAVDEGILTAEEVTKMGWKVEAPPEPVEVVSVPDEIPDPPPDFDTMKKDELIDWANEQEPPIFLDRKKRKSDLADDARVAWEERK